jgi:hypothetical protein
MQGGFAQGFVKVEYSGQAMFRNRHITSLQENCGLKGGESLKLKAGNGQIRPETKKPAIAWREDWSKRRRRDYLR